MSHSRFGRAVRFAVFAAIAPACASLALPAHAQVKLEEKYPPGRVLKYKTVNRIQQVLTLNATPIESQSTQTVLSEESVGKQRDDATLPVTVAVESFKADLAIAGLNVSFDSAQPAAKIENPQLAFLGDIFKLLSQIRYTLVLDQAKQIKAIEGTEALVEKAEKMSDPAKQAIMGRVKAETLKEQHQQARGRLPEILVRPGESWERTETLDLDAGQTLTFRKKYEYLGTEKKGDKTLDKIGVAITQVTYAQDPAVPTPLKVTQSDLKVDSSSGTILFDREGGYIVLDKGTIRVKGGMTFTAGGQEIPAKLDLTIERETETLPSAAVK